MTLRKYKTSLLICWSFRCCCHHTQMSNRRTHQLRELQKSVAKEECIPYFDFGHIWEGWQHLRELYLRCRNRFSVYSSIEDKV